VWVINCGPSHTIRFSFVYIVKLFGYSDYDVVLGLLQAKISHMFVEEQVDEYFQELIELPGM